MSNADTVATLFALAIHAERTAQAFITGWQRSSPSGLNSQTSGGEWRRTRVITLNSWSAFAMP